ncbi:MAG: hypothetical protein IPH73_14725 [Rhodocyclales bacterium]|nr:hypothetical protein [Rhodocyclales bacterium]
MNDGTKFSDERLNAYVDNQLGIRECDEILAAIATDVRHSASVCALRALPRNWRAMRIARRRPRTASHARRRPVWSGRGRKRGAGPSAC